MRLGDRSDLLAFLTEYARRPGLEVRRAERWRRRGWTFGRIAVEAERAAAALASHGVGPGDRVALHLHDGPLWHAAFFGVLRAGGVAVPLDAAFEPELLREIALDLDLSAICTEDELPALGLDLPRLALDWRRGVVGGAGPDPSPAWPPDDPERTAEIVLTSGTTGVPAAVHVSHGNLRAVLNALAAEIEARRLVVRLASPLRLAVALPLSHLYGQVMGVFVPALLGARATLLSPMPAPDLARALREERAWVLATVPRTLALLGQHLRAHGEELWGAEGMEARLAAARERPWWRRWAMFRRLRGLLGQRLFAVVSGGAALDSGTEVFWRALGHVVLQGYGLTETAPLATLNHPFDSETGSIGRPLPGVEVRIAEDGEMLVRGPNVVDTHPDGWLHTGDLGRRDAAGRLYYLGRKGERIVTSAGVNVDPGPVVARLVHAEGVLDAVVMERPWGERGIVCAVLAVRPGAAPAEAVRAANRDLPDAARVRSWHVWPDGDFPRTRTGKARQSAIREWLERQAPEGHVEPVEVGGPSDAFAALARSAAEIAGGPASGLSPDLVVADLLTSLDRVDLIGRIETTYGVTMGPDAFAGDTTLGDLADAMGQRAGAHRPATGASPARDRPRGDSPAANSIPVARWRSWSSVRATRFAFREAVLRPLWATFFDMDVAGLHHLEKLTPPFIVATNHLSEIDPGAVLFALPARRSRPVATTAMWEYFSRARTGAALYALAVWGLDLIPLVQLGDWRPTLRIAGAVADRGGCPLVYPEGERSLDGALLPFHRGVAVMAQELHLPILPCGAAGLLTVLPKGSRWVRNCWLGRAPVAVRLGAPVPPPQPDEDLDAVAADLRARIESLAQDAVRSAGRW